MRIGLCASAVFAWTMLAGPIAEAHAADYPRNEMWLGAGGATGFENSVYNLPNDAASSPELAFSLGFLRNRSARHAIGVYVYGADETTPVPGGSPFTLTTGNLGVRYRYTFTRRSFVPYLFARVNFAYADLFSSSTGDNSAAGVSGCIGPGVGIRLGHHFMLAAEGMGSYGVAKWETLPAAGSSDRDFNPSLLAGMIHVGYT